MDESKEIMTRYLLGELSETEQSALEERYFTDPEVFNQVLKIESELVDGYARDELSKELRARFERSYMAHPSRIARVEFAEALTNRIDQNNDVAINIKPNAWWRSLLDSLYNPGPVLKLSVAMATVLLMIGGVAWIFIETQQSNREVARLEAAAEAEQQRLERERKQNADEAKRRDAELAAQQGSSPQITPSPTPKSNSPARTITFALTVAGVRSGNNSQTPTLVIPADTTQAQLILNLRSNDFPSYRATLQTVAGTEILNQTNIKPKGTRFTFTVPASKLVNGDYVLTLRGVSPNGEVEDLTKSLFRVDKK
jgi:hypothetical protein